MQIIHAQHEDHIIIARELFEEYAAGLGFDLCFQNFAKELAELPGEYAPPSGCLLLAFKEAEAVGCVGLRKFGEGVSEIKRLYVKPKFRGEKIGARLATEVVEEARRIGYTSIRLDTHQTMERAVVLYRSLGFREIEPYRYNPFENVLFMELIL